MLDNLLIRLIIQVITAGLPSVGLNTLLIKQGQQPTQQGVNTAPTGYFFKVGPDHPYGFPNVKDVFNTTAGTFDHIESQQYESTFQMMTQATQNPLMPNALTASDILNYLRYILQSRVTIATFEAQNIGVLKITEVRNPYFKDDSDTFQASPSFDFTLTHKQTIITSTPVVETDIVQVLSV